MLIPRKTRRARRRFRFATAIAIVALGTWWTMRWVDGRTAPDDRAILPPLASITTDRPEIHEPLPPQTDIPEHGSDLVESPAAPQPAPPPQPESGGQPDHAKALMLAGQQALGKGDLIAARTHFSDAMQAGHDESEWEILRAELTRLGQETVLSTRIFDGDPFVARYVVQSGDSLAKIATANKVTIDFLAQVNGIADKNMIRVGQALKVVRGPFHARVKKSAYSLDVYLDATFVKHFRVGLGADNSTPTGVWKVATKLVNPTYYPPRGGEIVSADDPQNPLGERWIGLSGVAGEAVGQERYGIHGTIEPNSIGRSVSMGCIRMHNEDVAALYDYLVEKHSTVTIED